MLMMVLKIKLKTGGEYVSFFILFYISNKISKLQVKYVATFKLPLPRYHHLIVPQQPTSQCRPLTHHQNHPLDLPEAACNKFKTN